MFEKIITQDKAFTKIQQSLKNKKIVLASDLEGGAKPLYFYNLSKKAESILVVCSGPQESQQLFEELLQYDGDHVLHFPQADILPHERIPRDISLLKERMFVLEALLKQKENIMIVTSIQALLQGLIPPQYYQQAILSLEVNKEYDYRQIFKQLIESGYQRVEQVETYGQFSQRGSIIDIFPITFDAPLRIEFYGDQIDSMRCFDLTTQRSQQNIEQALILPAREDFYFRSQLEQAQILIRKDLKKMKEKLQKNNCSEEAENLQKIVNQDIHFLEQGVIQEGLAQYLPYFYPEIASLIDFFPADFTVILNQGEAIINRGKNYLLEMGENQLSLLEQGQILPNVGELFHALDKIISSFSHSSILISGQTLPQEWDLDPAEEILTACGSTQSYSGRIDKLIIDIKKELKAGYQVVISLSTAKRCQKMSKYLKESNLDYVFHQKAVNSLAKNAVNFVISTIKKGFTLDGVELILHTENEILGQQRLRKKRIQDLQEGVKIESVNELSPGDYVVHENHGIGKYLGIQTESVLGSYQDYLIIKYAGADKLYVPTHQVHLIQKYLGAEDQPPRLYRLGGGDWNRIKKRVKESLQELAFSLLKLYAEREALRGYSFGEDTVWQKEFEEAFPYNETPDQARAISEIKKDMESRQPMDRLLCGDVGYGKTEVAIRASFKACMDSKQVALLVPTTILAHQHYNTFRDRFEEYPVKVEMISRFRTAKEQKAIIKKVRSGEIDIIIGTHRLLSGDLKFKDLGLLIVDEEQRFGVAHKEKIKDLKKDVDVLTLTATPIPRTLHMSMVGVRNMSIIETPPQNRYPIRTYVRENSQELIKEAIKRELARNGQIYFVHNRVEDIDEQAFRVQKLLPEAKIAVAHGQMSENKLEKIMIDFLSHRFDILVCTTIIETGMDIPNVNTIIINNADYFGLAQLYQLRGRVGRSNRVAYAYLFYKAGKVLSEHSQKRLLAIKEFTNLGSGFKLAMRDLEIRGAGNLLGPEQHGHIAAIGFTLYCKLLEETVQEMQGKTKTKLPEELILETDWDTYIPKSYIADNRQKIEIYKKLSRVNTQEELVDLIDELIDRFGEPPQAVKNLLWVVEARCKAAEKRITDLKIKNGLAHIILEANIPKLGEKVVNLASALPQQVKIRGSKKPQVTVKLEDLTSTEAQKLLDRVLEKL